MVKKRIAVIGSGLGGLAAAIRLSVMGCKVDVYEKNESAGGKAGEINLDGFRFDTGPSLLTMPFVLEELFNFAGENIQDYLELKKMNVLCKYYYPDETVINAYSDPNKLAEEVERNSIDSASCVLEYLKYCKTIYDLSADMFLFNSFSEIKNFMNLKALKTLLRVNKLDTNRTMHKANSSFFTDAKIVQLFDRYATYNGSNPFEAPATLNVIPHVEYNLGGYISSGGIRSIVNELIGLAERKGVNFFYNSDVQQIIQYNGQIEGVKVNGELKEYDVVVSNADVEYTYKKLLDDTNSTGSKRYDSIEKSTSAVVFYWGVKGSYPQLETHNILFSEDYKKEFDELFVKKIVSSDPTVYIYISSKFRSQDAPENCTNWFVMVNTPSNRGQDWLEESKRIRQKVLSKIITILGLDIENLIKVESVLTPENIEKNTNSTGGSIYGISSNSKKSAFLRQQNKSKDYKGLYFTGGSSHPGGGIPLVLLSGKITSELISKYELN